jgi:hypothetical protein
MYREKGIAMKYEERILASSAVAVRSPHKLSTPFARQGGSIHGESNHLNYLRQGTALAVPKSGGLQGFQPLRRLECVVRLAPSETDWSTTLQITRHTMPSNFRANSLKTKKSGPHYSTHNSRGCETQFRTLNLIGPPKFRQVKVNY